MRTLLATFTASLFAAAPVVAQDRDGNNTGGFYLGAGLGDFSTEIDELARRYDLEISRGSTELVDDSDRDPVFGADLGVTIGERMNLRAEYEVVEIDRLDDSHAVWLTAAWRF